MPTPVDHDPFAEQAPAAARGGKAVDHDPFESTTSPVQESAKRVAGQSSGFLDEALSSATFGLSEELSADEFALITGAENAVRMATGKSIPYGMGEARNAMISAQREKQKDFQSRNPWLSFGADVLGGAMTPGGKQIGAFVKGAEDVAKTASGAEKAAQFGGRVARSGIVGGAMGGARGLATPPENAQGLEGDISARMGQAENDFIEGALFGSGLHLTGAAMANGLPVAAKYIGKNAVAAWQTVLSAFDGDKPGASAEALAKARTQALEYVHKVAEAAGKTVDDIRNSPAFAAGKPQLGAETLGRGGVAALGAVGRRAGATAEPLESTLRQRSMAGPMRVVNDLAGITGVDPALLEGDFDKNVKSLQAKAAPLYEAVHSDPFTSPELEALAKRPAIKTALATAYRDLQNAGQDPEAVAGLMAQEPRARLGFHGGAEDLPDVEIKNPTVKTWDLVKRALDANLESKRDPVTGKLNVSDSKTSGILTALTDFRDTLLEQVPGLRLAYEAGGEAPKQREAWEYAAKGITPAVSIKQFMDRFSKFTDAQKEALKGGFIADIYNRATNSRSVAGRLRLADMRTPAFREKARMILGGEQEAKFQDYIAQEMSLNETGNRMIPGSNSATYEWTAEDKEQKEAMSTLARAGKHLLSGSIPKAIIETGRLTKDIYGSHQDVNVRNEIGKLLLLPPDKLADALAQTPIRKSQKAAQSQVLKLLDTPEKVMEARRVLTQAILSWGQIRKEGKFDESDVRRKTGLGPLLPPLNPDAALLSGPK